CASRSSASLAPSNTNDTQEHTQREQERAERDWGSRLAVPQRVLESLPLGHQPAIVRVDELACGKKRQGEEAPPHRANHFPTAWSLIERSSLARPRQTCLAPRAVPADSTTSRGTCRSSAGPRGAGTGSLRA